jgi:hypothetical protein
MHRPILVLLLLLTFCPLAWAQSTDRPPVKDGKFIDALIVQLGSSKFEERASAQKQLDAIGAPALAALKKAKQIGDLELSRRAGELVRKIEEREFQADMLRPKRLRLNVADLPIAEAVAKLAKVSGYALQADGNLKTLSKKITLDTGAVTFWEAFDKLCTRAGLIEKMAVPYALFHNRVTYITEPCALTLLPGTPKNESVNYAGSVRFRLYALPKEKSADYRLMLEAAAEPRLDGFALVGAPNIKKSVDEHGHDLVFDTEARVAQEPKRRVINDGVNVEEFWRQYAFLHFKPAKESSRTLAELRGSYTVQIKTPEERLTVDKVLESVGKIYNNGKHGETFSVDEFQTIGPGKYSARFTWTIPLVDPFGGGHDAWGWDDLVGDPVAEIFDSKGNKLDRLPSKGISVQVVKGAAVHKATVVFQANAGQSEPARLVLIDMRPKRFEVPFMFQNVPLE